MLSLGTLPVLAQEAPKPDPTQLYSLLDGRTIVKTDPLSVVVGKLNLQVERLLAHGVSAQLGLYFTPEGATGTQSGAFHFQSYALSNSAILSPEQPRYIAISAQHKVVDDKMQYISVDYDGQATTHSYGLSIGAQWLFGRRKNIVLDWHILGVGRGFTRGSLTGTYTPAVSHAEVEKALRQDIPRDMTDAVFTFDATQPQVKVSKIKQASDIFDMGVSIGFRF